MLYDLKKKPNYRCFVCFRADCLQVKATGVEYLEGEETLFNAQSFLLSCKYCGHSIEHDSASVVELLEEWKGIVDYQNEVCPEIPTIEK